MFNPVLKSFFILLLNLNFNDTLKSSYIKDWYCKKKKKKVEVQFQKRKKKTNKNQPIVSSGIKIDI